MSTGWVWHERCAWHDARGLIDTLPRAARFEPEPSLESGTRAPARPPRRSLRRSGYCLLSNIAVSVLRLRYEHGLERVAVVDWDVHHGNGTQASFWHDGSVLHRLPGDPVQAP